MWIFRARLSSWSGLRRYPLRCAEPGWVIVPAPVSCLKVDEGIIHNRLESASELHADWAQEAGERERTWTRMRYSRFPQQECGESVCIYTYTYIHTSISIYLYLSLSLYTHIYIYIYILSGRRPWIASGERSRVRQHLATQALLSKCEFFIYMYITIYIYIYIYIYVYVYDQRIGCRRVHRVLLSNGPPEEDLNPALLFRSYALESKYGESNPCAAKMHTKEEGSRDFASSKSIAAWDVFPLDSKSSSDLSTRDSQILCPADC